MDPNQTMPYWEMPLKQRLEQREQVRTGFFNERLYSRRTRRHVLGGLFDWGAWDDFNKSNLDQFRLAQVDVKNSVAMARARKGDIFNSMAFAIRGGANKMWNVGGQNPILGLAGTALGAYAAFSAGAATLYLHMFGGGFGLAKGAISREEIESIGIGARYPANPRFINTTAARTMRQASLSAMHNSVYSLRGALGNEASMYHG